MNPTLLSQPFIGMMSRRLLGFCLLLLGLLPMSHAQCPTGNVTLSTQAQVNAFPPGCVNFPAILTISGSDITNLTSLSALQSVSGNLQIRNNALLTNLTGLARLTNVGGILNIQNNLELTSLAALTGLTRTGADIQVLNNAKLTSLTGLSSVTNVGGDLRIQDNAQLTSLMGLMSLTSIVGNLRIISNPQLGPCAIAAICQFLIDRPQLQAAIISGNAPGCASEADVQQDCTPLTITTQPPSSSTVCAGASVTAIVATSGNVRAYQWYQGNLLLPNQTTATLSLTNVQSTDNGAYRVVVSNSVNSLTANAFSLTVNAPPTVSITANPSLTINQGSATLLTASGADTYRWSTGQTTPAISVSTAGTYSVTATSGSCSSLTSVAVSVVLPCGAVVYITPSGAGQQDGSSWTNALPGTGLQTALNTAAGCGAQVWLAAGLYKPTTGSDRSISFLIPSGVQLYGGFQSIESSLSQRPQLDAVGGQPSSTTLSGNIGDAATAADNAYHVVQMRNASAQTRLDGLVITGGNADDNGGGLLNDGSGGGGSSSPVLSNISFVANSAAGSGGAIYNNGRRGSSSPVFTNVSFVANSAAGNGGAIFNGGDSGGSSSPVLSNISFIRNSAAIGGGIYNNGKVSGSSSPVLTNVSFVGNSAANGGAIVNDGEQGSSSPVLTNVSFVANSATTGDGGAIYSNGDPFGGISSPVLTNVSFQANTAGRGQALYLRFASLSMTNSIIFNNGTDNAIFGGTITARFCLFEVGLTGYTPDASNLTTTTNPFVSTTATQLAAGSPAIDAGNSSAPGLTGIPTDLAGNPRIVGCRVDLGPYEVQTNTSQPLALVAQPVAGSAACVGTTVTATVSVTGTVTGYQWYKDGQVLNPAQTTATLSLNSVQVGDVGSYSVVVTGACNSVTSTAFSLTVNAPPTNVSLQSSGTLSCAQTSVTLTASATGGTAYTLTGGAGPQTNTNGYFIVSQAGSYTVTVANAGGCTAVASVSVSQDNSAPSASLVSSGTLSCAVTSVTLTANPNGLSYVFSAGATPLGSTNQAVVSTPGLYSVTVVSGNGCSGVASVSVSQDNSAPSASLVSSGNLSCEVTSVTLTANPNGLNYTFSAGGTRIGSSNQAVVSTPGLYSVTVVSGNGCSSVASVSVSQDNSAPSASLVSSGTLSCGVTSVTLTTNPNGLSYVFSAGATPLGSTNQAVVSTPGLYSVTVVSGNGCSAVASVSVSQDNSAPSASLVSSGTLSCAVTSVTLTANPNGLSYVFSAGATRIGTSNQAIVSTPGLYSVTVVSGNGCSGVASVSVSQDNTAPSASLVSSGTLSCAVTSVTLTANPNGLSYVFSAGATPIGSTNQAVVSTPGLYSVTVVSGNGCSGVATTFVSSNTVSVTVTSPTLKTTTVGVGFSQAFLASPTGSYSFSVASGSLPPGLTLAPGGVVSGTPTQAGGFGFGVQATDGQGCSGVSSPYALTISPALPSGPATLTITSFSCFSINNALSGVQFVVGYSDNTYPPIAPLFLNGITTTGQLGVPYSLNFDANQSELPIADQASRQVYFVWNYRAACASQGGTLPVTVAPAAPALPNQTATVGNFFSYIVPAFTGTAPISYSATGLPTGLSFDAGSRTISGTPSLTGVSTVVISAANAAGQSSGQFTLTVSGSATQPTGPATLTITSFTCVTTNGALSGVNFVIGYSDGTFTPALPNLFINGITITGQLGVPYGLSFDANQSELPIADNASRRVYFVWNYRQACQARSSRVSTETSTPWQAVLLGNPATGDDAELVVLGGQGQRLLVRVSEVSGRVVSQQGVTIEQPRQSVGVRLGGAGGVYLLQVSDGVRQQTLRVLRP